MRIKPKPIEPVRDLQKPYSSHYHGEVTVGYLLDCIRNDLESLNNPEIDIEEAIQDTCIDIEDNNYSIIATFIVPESIEEFDKRYKKYEADLAKWQQWYDENKDAILAQEQAKKDKEEKRKLSDIKRLEKELDLLKKRLAKAKKE